VNEFDCDGCAGSQEVEASLPGLRVAENVDCLLFTNILKS
jgi:hypothetical protein